LNPGLYFLLMDLPAQHVQFCVRGFGDEFVQSCDEQEIIWLVPHHSYIPCFQRR
jgi:hypothetical protein